MVLKAFLGLPWAHVGSFGGYLGSSLGPLDRPKRASRFVLELSWASFARFLLPKMALGGFWGRLWLVLGAPEGLLRVVLASVKPFATIKTALSELRNLMVLVPDVVVAVVLVVVLVVIFVVALFFCHFSSARPGGCLLYTSPSPRDR